MGELKITPWTKMKSKALELPQTTTKSNTPNDIFQPVNLTNE